MPRSADSASTSIAPCSTPRRLIASQRSSTLPWSWALTASRCRPLTLTSVRRTSNTSSIAAKPSSCSAMFSNEAPAKRSGHSVNRACSSTSWRETRAIFGWQKPCYLLGEGYAKTFDELMNGTDWDSYGTGNYEKCANCMVHSGYEASAVNDAVAHPLKALAVSLRGPRTEGEMTPEISLDRQRPAEYVFSKHVEHKMEE